MSTIPSPLTASLPLSTNGTAHQPAPLPGDVTGQLMTISPHMAFDLLRNRLPNRPVSKSRVRQMIQDMRGGKWVRNGEPIILSSSLEVLDGQHRLQAIYESGVTVEMMVVVGIDPAAMPSIDSGKSKVAGDLLAMAGIEQGQQLASAARWLYRYENARMRESTIPLRNSDLPAYVQTHPSLSAALPWGRLVRDLIPQSCASMLYYVTSQKDPAMAKRFFDALARGDDLKRDHPAHVARERLLRDKSPKNHAGVLSRAALLVLAWNCVRLDRAMPGSLAWKGVTDPAAPFPEVV